MEYRLREPVSNPRRYFSLTGLALFVILAVSTLLQVAGAALIKTAAPQWTLGSWYIWALTFLPLYAVAVPVGYLIFKRIPVKAPLPGKMRIGSLLSYLFMCICVMYIGNIIGLLFNALIERIGNTPVVNPLESYVGATNLFLSVLFMVILAPIVEEYIFRKLIIDRLGIYGEGAAILVSALTFALFHGNFYQFFYAFGLGAMFAFLYLRTGRLRYTVILHMAINFTGGILGPALAKSIDLDRLADISSNNAEEAITFISRELPKLIALSLYLLMMIGFAAAGLVLIIVKRKSFALVPAERQLKKGTAFKVIFLNIGMILFVVLSGAMVVSMLFGI